MNIKKCLLATLQAISLLILISSAEALYTDIVPTLLFFGSFITFVITARHISKYYNFEKSKREDKKRQLYTNKPIA